MEPDKSQDTIHQGAPNTAKTTALSWRQVAGSGMARHVTLALLGLCGVVVVLLCTSRYGVGTSPDSASYLSAARSLLARQGYRCFDGGVHTGWPPLYPTLLAATGLLDIDLRVGARLLNSLAFGVAIFLSGQLFLRCTTSKGLAVAGTFSILASNPLVYCSVMAWSEPVFIVLALLFVLYMPGFLRRKELSRLVLISIVAGLACLQRYAGVSLILAGFVLIGSNTSRASLFQRLRYLVIFGVISTTPVALWCIRNRVLAGETVGVHRFHLASHRQFLCVFRSATQVVATWLFPWAQAGSIELIHLGLVMMLAATVVVLSRRIDTGRCRSMGSPAVDGDRTNTSGGQIWSAIVVGLVYFGFLLVCGAGLDWRPGQRHMAPIYPFVMVLMVAGIEGACRLLSVPFGHKKLVNSMGIFLCMLWLQYPLRELAHGTAHCIRDGAGGYSTSAWENSPLVEWLRHHPLQGKVYSNRHAAVYLLTGTGAATTPGDICEPAEFARRCASQVSYIVWFHAMGLPWLWQCDLREVLSHCRVQQVAMFADGTLYRILGEGGPGVSAVYRFWSPKLGRHFYTIQKAERNRLFNEDDGTWTYEGPVFYAFAPGNEKSQDVRPVYELRSADFGACLYTMDEAEKDRLLNHPSGAWTCKGIAFYAWPQAGEKDVTPVYRFWSERLGCHLYTGSEDEKTRLITEWSQAWTYEGIAWHAYGPSPR